MMRALFGRRKPVTEPQPWQQIPLSSPGADLIACERDRQIRVLGYTADHDDEHHEDASGRPGQLMRAAYAYRATVTADTRHGAASCYGDPRELRFPWGLDCWQPSMAVRNLSTAGALAQAEMDRLRRRNGTEHPIWWDRGQWRLFNSAARLREDCAATIDRLQTVPRPSPQSTPVLP